jgi:hypothetical protein
MSDNMHLIHPEHPFSEPRITQSGKSAIRPSGGLLSERRLVYFLSGAPTAPVSAGLKGAADKIQDELRSGNGFVVVMAGPPVEFF